MAYPTVALMEPRPLSDDALRQWQERIRCGQALAKQYAPWEDAALKLYAPRPSDDPKDWNYRVNTGRAYTLVEQKIPQVFYQQPDVTLKASPLIAALDEQIQAQQQQTQQAQAMGQPAAPLPPLFGPSLRTHQDILNEYLGPDKVDAVRLWKLLIRDAVTASGFGVSVMGYEQFSLPLQPDPKTPGAILNIGQPIQVPIVTRCFWEHLSPRQLIRPAEFTGHDFDKSPWLAYRHELPIRLARKLGLSLPAHVATTPAERLTFDYGLTERPAGEDVLSVVTLYYQAAIYDDDVANPYLLRELLLADGIDTPLQYRNCPYQQLQPDGQLTPTSLVGYPIVVETVRDLPDAAVPLSDVALITPTVHELNQYREDQIKLRKASKPMTMVDGTRVLPDTVDKIVSGDTGSIIVMDGPIDSSMAAPLVQPRPLRETYEGQDKLDQDLARMTALDVNQQGVQTSSAKTATEQQLVQANANVRLEEERTRWLLAYVKAVTKFSTLLAQYVTVEDAAKIVGPMRAQAWATSIKTLPAALAFTAKPNSAIRVDQALEQKRAMEEYSFFANEPYINRLELLRETLTRCSYNVEKLLMTQPPEPKPDPVKGSIAIKVEDFGQPWAPIAVEIAQQLGLTISPQAQQATQGFAQMYAQMLQLAQPEQDAGAPPKHGGKVSPVESLDKHHADETGGMQGSGQRAPLAPGGQVM